MSKIINGVLVEVLNTPNRNGRIYKTENVAATIEAFNKRVPVIGELGSPSGNTGEIRLDNASHIIHKLKIDGDNVIADVQLLSTPKGKIVEDLIRTGQSKSMGFGFRGLGKIEQDSSGNSVVTDFNLITIDIVSNPLPGYEIRAELFAERVEAEDSDKS